MKYIYAFSFLILFCCFGTVIKAQTTWYTLASGDWDDTEIWTLDPAGAIPVGISGPTDNDNVVILSGKTVVVPDGIGDYADPLRQDTLTLGTVTIQGQLDLRTSTGHTFDILKGSGRLLMAADNYPSITTSDADFITKGEGEGTVVFYGDDFEVSNSYTFCNLEVDMNTGQTVTLSNDLVLNDQLNVSGGTLQINGIGTTALNLTVNGDVMVESQGNITVGSGNAFHWLNVYGDFINAGTVTLSNSAQYAEATNGAVKLKFQGEFDNVLECYNNTVLYRIFVDKGSDKTYGVALSADNISYFSLYGPVTGTTNDGTDGTSGYERAPIVIENGTLELGSNIIIDRIAENITGSTPNEFTIPETGRLIVNGAEVATAGTLGSTNEYSGVNVQGQFKMVSGIFTTPENSSGLTYIENTGEPASVIIQGGILNLTNLKRRDSNGLLNYFQSGGTVNFQETGYFHNVYGGTGSNAVFSLPNEDQVFNMSGGTMVFGIANSDHVTGIFINSGQGNYSVTGGTIEVYEPLVRNFNIYSATPFYNLTILNNSSSSYQVQFTGIYGGVYNASNSLPYFTIKNDLTISTDALFADLAHTKYVGGDLVIEGTYTQTGPLIFNGSSDGEVVNNSGSTFSFDDFVIYKDVHVTGGQFYTMSLTGANNISISGNLDILRGAIDVVDFWATVADSVLITDGEIVSSGSGGLELNGSTQQVLQGAQGKEQEFGFLKLNNTGSSPQFLLLSDVNTKTIEFLTDQVFDIDVYNLDVDSVDYTSGSWSSSRMFRTTGEASDGSLTLPIELDGSTNGLVQVFPIGTTSGFSPASVYVQNSPNDSGEMTVKYSDDYHPTVDDPNGVVDFFWRVNYTGLSSVTSSDMRYTFTYYNSIPTGASRRGMIFQEDNTWYDAGSDVANGSSLEFGFNDPLVNDYTWGRNNAFNNVRTLYSKSSGDFNATSTWTTSTTHIGGDANPAPRSYDLVVIGGASGANHTVTVNANDADASQVWIKGKSDTGIGAGDELVDPPSLVIASGTSGHEIEVIKGNGKLVYQNDLNYGPPNLISGDHKELCNSSEAIVEFAGSGNYTIPIASNTIPYYPNLVISGGGTKSTPYANLSVGGDLTVDDADFTITGVYAGSFSIGDSLKINTGTLTLPSTSTNNTYVNGSIVFNGAGTLQGGNVENKLYLDGNIILSDGATINCNSSNKANFAFEGDSSAIVSLESGTATVDFYRLYINKPTAENVQFDVPFNLEGTTDGATKSLILQSGECILNNSGINIDLTTGSTDFSIPSGTKLYVTGGTVNASGNSGIKLDGSFIIDGGTANIDGTLATGGSANSSYIAFTSSGDAYLEISNSGSLYVGDQIRRVTTTDEGILNFVQNGGTVDIGTVGDDLQATRGMFEILGAGSAFVQAAGDTIVINGSNGSTTVPSLYFAPEATTFGTGSAFVVKGTDEVGIYATVPLNDLVLDENEGCSAKILIADLELNNLTIGATNLFEVNNKDLYINGDFTNNASSGFNPGSGTVYFVGSGDQILGGSQPVLFNDLVHNSGAQLTVDNAGVTIGGDLEINASCVFATGDESVDVYGDLTNSGTTTCSLLSNGIVMNGSDVQQITGTGTFAALSVNNANGIVVPTQSGSVTITDRLRMESGVLDIGKNLLVLNENASFVPVNAFSTTNMVQTNLSFTDNGIKKYFPVIASSTDFVYPLGSSDGSLTKYTPVTFTITNNGNNTGSIRVKAANESHISIIDNTSTAYDDTQNVLKYNWTLDAVGIEDFSASVVMQGVASDVSVTDGNSADDYITACILADGIYWNKYSTDDFYYDSEITQLTFTFGSTDDIGINGDYTAGIADAIPDQVASFISVTDGDYSTTNTWAVYDPDTETIGTPGVSVPAGGPRGSIIYVVDSVRFADNFEAAYRSYVEASGVADMGTSFGHRLGNVYGTGKIRVESGSLPAGTYDDFFSVSGGTLEYAGTTDYDVLSEITAVNHLKFSGAGERRFPNSDFQLYGDLTIDGPDVINTYDADVYIQGNVIFDAGSFDAGLSTSTVVFNGSELQYIQGANEFITSNASAFFNMEVDNGAGVECLNNLDVTDQLILINGAIYTDDDRILTIRNSEIDAIVGGSDSSYVAGPMSKNVLNSSSFLFPVGYADVYGPVSISVDASSGGYWKAEYIGINPGSYTERPMDPTTITSPVEYVSHNEFWKIQAPADASNAQLTLTWHEGSGVNPAETGFSVVSWTTITPSWEQLGIGTPTGDSSGGSVSTLADVVFNEWTGEGSYFTFGAQDIPAYTWEGDDITYPSDWFTAANWSNNIVPSASSDVTITTVPGAIYPEISGTASMNNLTISSGELTVLAGSKVTIGGNLVTNDSLVIENTSDTPSSVIVGGTVTDSVTVQWNTLEGDRWWYMSHSISGDLIPSYQSSLNADGYYLFVYNNGTLGWDKLTALSSYDFTAMEAIALGILNVDKTLTIKGILNNDASYLYSASQDGYQNIGNPYPSYVDFDEICNSANTTVTEKTSYIYTTYGGIRQYATYNAVSKESTAGGSRYISPGQCFWVYGLAGSDVEISKLACTNDAAGSVSLKSSGMKSFDKGRLRLVLTNENTYDEVLILADGENGSEVVTTYDSEKKMNGGVVGNIYSIKESDRLAINSLPEFYDGEIIPLGYKVSASGMTDFKIKLSSISNVDSCVVYLDDLEEGVSVNLSELGEYAFTPNVASTNDRFQIRLSVSYSTESTTYLDSKVVSGSVSVYASGQKVYVNVSEEWLLNGERMIDVYNVAGQLVDKVELNDMQTQFELPNTGVYVIKVISGSNVYERKVLGR